MTSAHSFFIDAVEWVKKLCVCVCVCMYVCGVFVCVVCVCMYVVCVCVCGWCVCVITRLCHCVLSLGILMRFMLC